MAKKIPPSIFLMELFTETFSGNAFKIKRSTVKQRIQDACGRILATGRAAELFRRRNSGCSSAIFPVQEYKSAYPLPISAYPE